MARKYWIETTLQGLSEDEIVDWFSKYILIFESNSKTRGIYLCGRFVKFSPQEYKFLKAVLELKKAKRGESLMKSIGAICNSKKYSLQDYSYIIAKNIKEKITKAFNKEKYMMTAEFEDIEYLKRAKKEDRIKALKESIAKREKLRLEKYKNKTYFVIPTSNSVYWFDLIINDTADNHNNKRLVSTISYTGYDDDMQEIDLNEYLDKLIYCKNGRFKALWPFASKY